MLSVVMLNVIYAECRKKTVMLNVIMLSVMGPVLEPTQVESLTEVHTKGGFYIV